MDWDDVVELSSVACYPKLPPNNELCTHSFPSPFMLTIEDTCVRFELTNQLISVLVFYNQTVSFLLYRMTHLFLRTLCVLKRNGTDTTTIYSEGLSGKRAQALGRLARHAVETGGSSDMKFAPVSC
jgi:hypothetical protein